MRFEIYAHFPAQEPRRDPELVFETDDEQEAIQFQLDHRRGRGLDGAASTEVIDAEKPKS